jgi:hypothetical protein
MTIWKLATAFLLMPAAASAGASASDAHCSLGQDAVAVARLHDMPPIIRADVERRVGRIAEPDELALGTDSPGPDSPPTRQFVRGFHVGRYWIIWYWHGGMGLHRHMLAYEIGVTGDRAHQRPAAILIANLYGDPCVATVAFLNGVSGAAEF